MQPLSLSNRSWLTVHVSKPYSNTGSTVQESQAVFERERGGDFQVLVSFLQAF